MANKIREIQVEPSPVEVGSTFKLIIKAFRGATYEDLKTKTYTEVKEYTYGELKGE